MNKLFLIVLSIIYIDCVAAEEKILASEFSDVEVALNAGHCKFLNDLVKFTGEEYQKDHAAKEFVGKFMDSEAKKMGLTGAGHLYNFCHLVVQPEYARRNLQNKFKKIK